MGVVCKPQQQAPALAKLWSPEQGVVLLAQQVVKQAAQWP
jgi:hypothetical protein